MAQMASFLIEKFLSFEARIKLDKRLELRIAIESSSPFAAIFEITQKASFF
jgi:hypothetical protein